MDLSELRAQRDDLLKASDFYLLADNFEKMSEGDQTIVLLYRQALRDLPASYDGGSETEVEWPVQPFTSTQEA
jgi:hypothetical protein